jgi:hypothetical protein
MDVDDRQISFLTQPEPPRIKIPNNEVLEKAANRILEMIDLDPTLTNGLTMAEINRHILGEILWRDGISSLIPSDKKADFLKIIIKTQDSEVYSRALRHLVSEDLVRLSASVIRRSEQFRAKISGAMR